MWRRRRRRTGSQAIGHTGELYLLRKRAHPRCADTPFGFRLVLFALRGLIAWPFSKELLFASRHAISLYASRLDVIAQVRGRWS